MLSPNQNPIDIYRRFHPITTECTFFSSIWKGKGSRIGKIILIKNKVGGIAVPDNKAYSVLPAFLVVQILKNPPAAQETRV